MSSKGIFYALGRALRETGQAVDRVGSSWMGNFAFREQLSRHRRIMPVDGQRPQVASESWVAPNATVAGNVHLGNNSSVFYGAVIRSSSSSSSSSSVHIGNNVIVGDRVTIVAPNNATTHIGNDVVVQSGASLHHVKSVGDASIIGESVVLLQGSSVGAGAVVEAGSVVAAGTEISPSSRWRGNPAVEVGKVSEQEREGLKHLAIQTRELAKKHSAEHAKDEAARQKDRVFAEFHKTPYSIYKESPF